MSPAETYGLPAGFLARMERLLGGEYPAFLAAYAKPRTPSLRVNALRVADPDGAGEAALRSLLPYLTEHIPYALGGYRYPDDPELRPGKHPYHEAGVYYIQEASAMIPAALCPPRPGDRVLDLCAAPGGKATQLAASLGGRGLLVANEIHPGRAAILSGNIERMGIPNALVLNHDPDTLAEHFPHFFDRITVDAPCSGEGMFRKEPQAAEMWSQANVELCAARQTEILNAAARMLAPGGTITYSTCTFAPEENEGTLLRFLAEHPDFDTVTTENTAILSLLETGILDSGRPDWVAGGEDYAESLSRAVRLFPHHADGEGHFAVLLRRRSDRDVTPPPARSAAPRGRRSDKRDRRAERDRHAEQGVSVTEAMRLFADMAQEVMGYLPQGNPCLFGDRLSLLPPDGGLTQDDLSGLRVLRAGLELGTVTRGRFVPAHALAVCARGDHAATLRRFDLDGNSPLPAAYLRGETLPCPTALSGWCVVTVDGFPLGWGKADRGVLKNHYPKGLRRM